MKHIFSICLLIEVLLDFVYLFEREVRFLFFMIIIVSFQQGKYSVSPVLGYLGQLNFQDLKVNEQEVGIHFTNSTLP